MTNNHKQTGTPVQPWALQWASTRSLSATGASLTRWQLLMALAAKRERTGR